MIIKRIKLPVYTGHLVLMKVDDFSEIPEKYKSDFDEKGFSALMWCKADEDDKNDFCIAFIDHPHGVIAHESLHCVNSIFHELHVEYTLMNDEHACYLLGWIVEQCYKFLE